MDRLLGGGFPLTGGILEISGQAGVGKTQLVLQISIMAAAPLQHGGIQSSAILAFTEGLPPVSRMHHIDTALCKKFDLPSGSLLHGVIIETIRSSDELLKWANFRLPYLLRETASRLVVIDSVAAVYRPDFDDPIARATHLTAMAAAVKHAMTAVDGVAVCVNQVSQSREPGSQSLNLTVPALGSAWGRCVATRIFLQRLRVGDDCRFAKVLASSYLPVCEDLGESYRITRNGVVSDD